MTKEIEIREKDYGTKMRRKTSLCKRKKRVEKAIEEE